MFVLSLLVYPVVLAALCAGSGLALDRLGGGVVPGPLLVVVGIAGLIAVVELATYIPGLAPASPYIAAGAGLLGLAAGHRRVRAGLAGMRGGFGGLALLLAVYVLAAAPVLLAGRPSFAAYMVLTDSALHMIGADYLVRHGQHFAHLDLANSYGRYLNAYYNNAYPTGADALLGASAALLRIPDIWAFQPFNAFVLAAASGPAWLLARVVGLERWWAALAALAASVPALLYAYELIGSIKEITAVPLVLAMGALVATHERWLKSGVRAAIPYAVVVAAGVSALGLAYGLWAAIATLILLAILIADGDGPRLPAGTTLAMLALGAIVLVVCAWPTWDHVSGALNDAQTIATTANRGNLVSPLRLVQVFGTWLSGSYQTLPQGRGVAVTDALIAASALAGAVGMVGLLAARRYAVATWLLAMVGSCLIATRVGGVWADAKTLVLSSSAFMLAAFAGAGVLRRASVAAAALLVAAIVAGVLASDFLQYHDTDLAPTARYAELASIGERFAGRGPTLFTDFDEYSLYELRHMDVGGPDFLYPPAHLGGIDTGHGNIVNILHVHARALLAYPLIVTRRDPLQPRPPSAYRLLWQGTYYQVWGRRRNAPAAIARLPLTGKHAAACSRVHAIATLAQERGADLAAARPAEIVRVDLARARRPRDWIRTGVWLAIGSQGRLVADFRLPFPARWNVWLQGEFMPSLSVWIDGRTIARIGGQVSGDAVVPDTTAPIGIELPSGRHTIALAREGWSLAPGNGGSAFLSDIFLTPAGSGEEQRITVIRPARWRTLCGHRYLWIEAVPRYQRRPRARMV